VKWAKDFVACVIHTPPFSRTITPVAARRFRPH
jgi:hypothetical protein